MKIALKLIWHSSEGSSNLIRRIKGIRDDANSPGRRHTSRWQLCQPKRHHFSFSGALAHEFYLVRAGNLCQKFRFLLFLFAEKQKESCEAGTVPISFIYLGCLCLTLKLLLWSFWPGCQRISFAHFTWLLNGEGGAGGGGGPGPGPERKS